MKRDFDPSVAAVFETYPSKVRTRLLRLRELILETADRIEGVGPITETLKWGEPAYLTEASRSGSTIRLGSKPEASSQFAIYFNCNTTLIDTFRTMFPDLEYQGNRAIVFSVDERLPMDELRECFTAALTYHARKRRRPRTRP